MDEYTARKIVRDRRVFERVRKACDDQKLPYPPELAQWLAAVQKYRAS